MLADQLAQTHALIGEAIAALPLPRIKQPPRDDGFPYPALDDAGVWRIVDRLGIGDPSPYYASVAAGVVDTILNALPPKERALVGDELRRMASFTVEQRLREWREGMRAELFRGVREVFPRSA